MPAQRTTPAPVPRAVRLLRLAANAIVLAVAFACALLLLVRLVVFPHIESRHDAIAAALAGRIGQPVAIGAIETGWDGWNPKLSIRGFTVSDAATRQPVLELPRVDLVVSWTSLPLLDLRLRELVLEGARLAVRRDARGRLHVAGMEIDPEAGTDDTRLSDWLMRQPRIVVHDGLLAWTDELRHAPQLVLDHVELRVEQGFGEHRFGLTGVPPAELAAPLDLRGEFSGGSWRDWSTARVRTYLRLDYADLAAWSEWLPPLPVHIERGKGALRLWFEFAGGEARALTADVELADVQARFGDELPQADLAHVAGRIEAMQENGRRELRTRNLSVVSADGGVLPPTNLTLRVAPAHGTAPAHAEMAFDQLALAPLAALATHLPLPASWRTELAVLEPQGTLRDGRVSLDGPPDAPLHYSANARFFDAAFHPEGGRPGATGLTGRLQATERKGSLTLDPHAATLALPQVLAEPLDLDQLQAQVEWSRGAEGLEVHVADARFANSDAAGSAQGTWRAQEHGPGRVDVRAHLTRATVDHVSRYLPQFIDAHVREWIGRALVRGTSDNADLLLRGDLAAFPFPDGRAGQFVFALKGHGATLDYAQAWPQLSDVEADVRFEGARLTIDASRGRVLGAHIGPTHVEIPDLRARPAVLRVQGSAQGPTGTFLDFIGNSPVERWIGQATQGVQASGDGRLALRFEMPLSAEQVSVAGEYEILGNEVRWPDAPLLSKVSGKVAFDNQDVRARDVTAEALGGPVRISVTAVGSDLHLAASGSAAVAAVQHEYALPLVAHASGGADWRFALDRTAAGMQWTFDSALVGTTLDLPAPLGKVASASVPLHVTRRPGASAREDQVVIDYGRVARIALHRDLAGTPRIDRALVQLGKAIDASAGPERDGIRIRAVLPAINVDDWLAWQRSGDAAGGSAAPAGGVPVLEAVDLEADVVQALGRKFDALKVKARRSGADWRLALDGRDVAGTATWQAATPAQPNGRVVARLTRLVPPGAGELPAWTGAPEEPARAANAANPWPAIDLTADAFFARGHDVGRLEIAAEPTGRDWHIRKLAVVNDAGRIDADGTWRGGRAPQTRLDVKVDVREAGRFLARFAMPDAIRAAPTVIAGQLAWAGAPSDFDYPSLSGTFTVHAGAGQFLKVDPGVGRLLGVLSLQALPRRISLDFRDVFSEGFAFDSANGTVRMQNGVMHTDALRLAGPAATVSIAGDVDLARETQALHVRVQPALSTSVSAGAAALFLANPLVGAAVGAGTFLAQKMFNNPIEQLFSYEYGVTGSWDDPQVQRVRAPLALTRGTTATASSGAAPPPDAGSPTQPQGRTP